jgi:hypothetical protein
MDEGDLEAEQARPRLLVDELGAAGRKPLELGPDVVNFEGDVMHAGPAVREELADRCFRAERSEQLDPPGADPQRGGLDSLVGHGLTMLELGTEKPLVGLDRRVQVGDRDADMVDPASAHWGPMLPADRRAKIADMRLATIAAPIAAVALLAGCGGSSGAKSNGEAAKTADQIVADAQAAALGATAVHVFGSAGTSLVVNLHLVAGKGGEGRMTANGLTFDIIRIGAFAYFKGDATFWRQFGGAAATLFNGRWLKAPAATGRLASLTPLTDIGKLFTGILGSHGTLAVGKETTIAGHPAIGIVDASKGGTLYVATTGKPYPVALRKSGSGAITFDEWDKPVKLTAPSNAVDISQLKSP